MARWACRPGVICAIRWWGWAGGFCSCGCGVCTVVLSGSSGGGVVHRSSFPWSGGLAKLSRTWFGTAAWREGTLGTLGWSGVGVVSLSRTGGAGGDCGWDGVGVESLKGSEWAWGGRGDGDGAASVASSKSMSSSSDSRGAKRLVVFFLLWRRFCIAGGILEMLGRQGGWHTGSVKVFSVSGYRLFPWFCDRHFGLVGTVGRRVFICVRLLIGGMAYRVVLIFWGSGCMCSPFLLSAVTGIRCSPFLVYGRV